MPEFKIRAQVVTYVNWNVEARNEDEAFDVAEQDLDDGILSDLLRYTDPRKAYIDRVEQIVDSSDK
jgi:hypothetical protein